jgi:hypothetical protein
VSVRLERIGTDEMRIHLTRKLADSIDGVDLSHKKVGKVIDVARHDAQLLIAEGWGVPADSVGERTSARRDRADDQPARSRKPRPKKHR